MGAQHSGHHRLSFGDVAGLSFLVDLIDSRLLTEYRPKQESADQPDHHSKKTLGHDSLLSVSVQVPQIYLLGVSVRHRGRRNPNMM
jgi:hypothetical protein